MAAFNDLNGVPCTTNRFLLRTLLREKLGFNGFVITDYEVTSYMFTDQCLAAGGDAKLTTVDWSKYSLEGRPEYQAYARNAAHHILYTVVNSAGMNGYVHGVEFVAGFAYYKIIIIVLDVIAAAGSPRTGLAKAMAADGSYQAPAQGSGLAGMVKGSDLKVWQPMHSDIAGEGEEFRVEKMPNIRKIIARSMYNSLQNSAQLTHMLGADARRIQALRKKAKKALEEGRIDANITINDFVCYAVIKAIQKFPSVNSHCLGDAMRFFNTVNLGVAVDTERGLMVPAIKSAENLNIVGLSKVLKKAADECRKGSFNPDLLSSEASSFTVSNLGGFGVEWFTPVLNLPQSCILGVGTIVPRPKDLGAGVYAFVPYMGLSLTYDHRAIDGGEATRFLKQVAVEIENLEVEF